MIMCYSGMTGVCNAFQLNFPIRTSDGTRRILSGRSDRRRKTVFARL